MAKSLTRKEREQRKQERAALKAAEMDKAPNRRSWNHSVNKRVAKTGKAHRIVFGSH